MLACLLAKIATPGAPVARRATPATARVLFMLLVVIVSSRVAGAPQATQALAMLPFLNTGDSYLGVFEYVEGARGVVVLFATSEYSPHCSHRRSLSFTATVILNSAIQ